MGDAPGALGGAIPWDKTLRGCCVLLPKRTILVCASVWYQSQGRYNPNGVLYQVYGHKIVYEVASFLNAKVSNVLQDKEWCWCPTRSEEMVDIQIKMSLNPITHSDRAVWSLTVAGLLCNNLAAS